MKLGRPDAAKAGVDSLIARRRRQYVDAFYIVRAYLALGDKSSALAWADTAFADRSPSFANPRLVLQMNPELATEPRFLALLGKAKRFRSP